MPQDLAAAMRAEALEEFHGGRVMRKAPLLATKCGGVRLTATAFKFRRVLLVEHFVVQDVGDDVARHVPVVEYAIDDNLIERRIEAS